MALVVARDKGVRAKEVYEKYYENELIIEYVHIANENHLAAIKDLDKKAKGRVPDRMIEVIPMTEEDYWIFDDNEVDLRLKEIKESQDGS